MDAVKNFAWSTVATAPSPATTGTSLTVAAGEGARYPAVPFNASVFPAGTMPTPVNAEIVRVTARTTDVLTITRTQEGSSARAIGVGDQIAAAITAKTLTDLDLGFANPMTALGDVITGAASGVPGRLGIGSAGQILTVSAGVPTWAANVAMVNPMTTSGDLIVGTTGGAPSRVGASSAGCILILNASVFPAWSLAVNVGSTGTVGIGMVAGTPTLKVSAPGSGVMGLDIVGATSGAGQNLMIVERSGGQWQFEVTDDVTNAVTAQIGGLFRTLTLGATDTGGAGFRMVRVAN